MIDYCLQEWVTTYLDNFWNIFGNVNKVKIAVDRLKINFHKIWSEPNNHWINSIHLSIFCLTFDQISRKGGQVCKFSPDKVLAKYFPKVEKLNTMWIPVICSDRPTDSH